MAKATVPVKDKLNLYELGEEVMALEDLVAMDEGEWTDEHAKLEEEIMGKLVAKADSFGGYVRSLEATAAACKAEAARLSARAAACANRVDKLKRFASTALKAMGKDKIVGELFTLANQESNPSAEITVGVDQLPLEYVRVVPEERLPDKVAILAALKAGAEIEGCAIVRTVSLRIR